VNFEPFKELFMSTYSRSRTSFLAFPQTPAVTAYPQRQLRGSGQNSKAPAVGLKLADLVQRLQV
jgi:coatomer subunit alpha